MNAAFTNNKVFSLMNIAFRYHCIPNLLYSQYSYDSIFSSYVISIICRKVFVRYSCEFAAKSQCDILRNAFIIARQKSCEKLANRRAASDEKPTPVQH